MSLQHELGLKTPIASLDREAILNIYYTTIGLKKTAAELFTPLGLTDVQFNVMVLLHYNADSTGGLSQAKISEMMLVNRANVTTLIDRMEKAGFVERVASETDRRFNIVKLTAKGKKLLTEVEPLYRKTIQRIMSGFSDGQQKNLIKTLEKLRTKLSK